MLKVVAGKRAKDYVLLKGRGLKIIWVAGK
jgi:hypothetical protein